MTQATQNRFRNLAIGELQNLATELSGYSDYAPLLSNGNGQYSGHILGFVKGLRLSAKLIYFLRKCLSGKGLEVSWGHIIDPSSGACSPECDVIIHSPGFYEKWNGGDKPVMDFSFIEKDQVKAVISCKSKVAAFDADYPQLLRNMGINAVYVFGESCSKTNYPTLKTRATSLGYLGFWVSYFTTGSNEEIEMDETHHEEFFNHMRDNIV